VDDQTLAFADYRGNRQYVSTGNLAADDRACLFLMDYPHRARLKIYARVETLALEDDPDLTALATKRRYKAKLERIFQFRLKTFDWIASSTSRHVSPSAKSPRRSARCATAWRSSNPKTPNYALALPPTENPNECSASSSSLECAVEKVRLAEDGWNSR